MALTSCVDDWQTWTERIEAAARLTLPDQDAVLAAGQPSHGRRLTAGLLLSSVSGHQFEGGDLTTLSVDEHLLAASAGVVGCPEPSGAGPALQGRSPDDVIELWTERELSMVHAAWLLPGWTELAERSARWLIDEIQPDNATNLPWAVQVFAHLSVTEGTDEARMYAETLLHNCMVSTGRPDPLSGLILLDAARQLRVRYAG